MNKSANGAGGNVENEKAGFNQAGFSFDLHAGNR